MITPYQQKARALDLNRIKHLVIEVYPEFSYYREAVRAYDEVTPDAIGFILTFAVESVLNEKDTSMWDMRHFSDFMMPYYEDLADHLGSKYPEDEATERLSHIDDALFTTYGEILLPLHTRLLPIIDSLYREDYEGEPVFVGDHFKYPYVVLNQYDR